ncbi:MAG: hypothetical protein V9G29_05765 [Burkholderiaceae bacterium]
MQILLKDDTQVYKQFVENESFRRTVRRHGLPTHQSRAIALRGVRRLLELPAGGQTTSAAGANNTRR